MDRDDLMSKRIVPRRDIFRNHHVPFVPVGDELVAGVLLELTMFLGSADETAMCNLEELEIGRVDGLAGSVARREIRQDWPGMRLVPDCPLDRHCISGIDGRMRRSRRAFRGANDVRS